MHTAKNNIRMMEKTSLASPRELRTLGETPVRPKLLIGTGTNCLQGMATPSSKAIFEHQVLFCDAEQASEMG